MELSKNYVRRGNLRTPFFFCCCLFLSGKLKIQQIAAVWITEPIYNQILRFFFLVKKNLWGWKKMLCSTSVHSHCPTAPHTPAAIALVCFHRQILSQKCLRTHLHSWLFQNIKFFSRFLSSYFSLFDLGISEASLSATHCQVPCCC